MVVYTSDGDTFAWIPKFTTHQKIDRPSPSKLPDPQGSTSIRRSFDEGSSTDQEGIKDQDQGSKDSVPGGTASASSSSFDFSNEEPKQEDPNPVVQRVFEHWRQTLGHPAAKLDRKRRQAITSALALGYTEQQLTIAIAGCASSPWHLGRNDRKTRYDALTLILRDAEQIDKFIGLRMTPEQQQQEFGRG